MVDGGWLGAVVRLRGDQCYYEQVKIHAKRKLGTVISHTA